jgi:twitching motility protein PilJ
MASSIQNQNDYERAKTAYIKGDFEKAAEIIEDLAKKSPNDPEVLLLKGHIYCYFQDFEGAKEQYNRVIENTESKEYIDCANSGLETVKQWQNNRAGSGGFSGTSEETTTIWSEEEDWEIDSDESELTNPSQNPFTEDMDDSTGSSLSEEEIAAISALEEDDEESTNLAEFDASTNETVESHKEAASPNVDNKQGRNGSSGDEYSEQGTLLYSPQNSQEENQTGMSFDEEEFDLSEFTNEEDFLEDNELEDNEAQEPENLETTFGSEEDQDLIATTQRWQTQSQTSTTSGKETAKSSPAEPDASPQGEEEVGLFKTPAQSSSQGQGTAQHEEKADSDQQALFASSSGAQGANLFSSGASAQGVADVAFDSESEVGEPVVEHEQGWLSFLENASLSKKRKLVTGAVGVASAVVVAVGSFAVSPLGENRSPFSAGNIAKSGFIGLIGGAASGAFTWVTGGLVIKQIKRATGDLQAQVYAVQQGNLEAKATIYSQDEFGQLATGFNQMTRVVSTTTREAQRKAQEQEQAKEELQQQVIRLLDDVEGAARGDLTVQAEVSADVLGAVSDAFNLTIRNLRTIVQQVKEAAKQVNEGAAESSSFAQGLSEDALKQAEELAVSLNSAQMMTESIQRVADNAKEAESVARTASETALKGGEAVDSTVSGILQIRQTVAESTRKVKRLAESSQEISKIVSVISQIATRTNNLAMNASIEAARAGEAGRGFAVIADEVRQLADRSTKSLRDIEKIVHQIQSETNSVMVGMEEGTQQVIEGTQRAEQAKNALEDIIQVSNRIDSLVQSITADTVEQSETAQSVAQVMQSVEMTAQGTSQESQQVSTALQNLVSLSGDLLASVERFRINPEDKEISK